MAYTASIAIAVKGIQDIQALRKQIEEAAKGVDKFNNFAKEAFGGDFVRSLNNVKRALTDAADAFDNAALGTSRAVDAAKAYVAANREMNATLKERERLLRSVTRAEGAEAMARIGVRMPAAQRLLPAGAAGGPAMSGGARRLITGQVERLGGARTADEAATALRFAQALEQQVRPLSQIESLYAGISRAAAQTSRFKALPDSAMLNAAGRGIQQLELSQDRYNRELAESIQRLQQVDRLETSRERRAAKLKGIANYYEQPSLMEDAGFGIQGPKLPPGFTETGKKPVKAIPSKGRLAGAFTGGAFPLLFGGGPGAVLGGFAGGLAGAGPAGLAASLTLSAIGQQFDRLVEQASALGKALSNPIKNFQTLKDSALISSKQQEKYIDVLIQSGDYAKAYSVIQKDLIQNFGPDTVNKLEALDKANDKYKRQVAELSLRLQALSAGPMIKFLEFVTQLLERFNTNANLPPELQQRREDIMRRARTPVMLGGATPAEVRTELEALTKEAEKYAQNPPEKKLQPWTEEYIQSQQKLRDLFVERYDLQLNKEAALLKLNGTVLEEDKRRLDLEVERLSINNRLYAAKKQLQDIEAAGGTAKGIAGSQELKNEITRLETQKINIDIQIKEESLNRFTEQVTAAAEAATRALDLEAGAISGQETLRQTQYDLLRSANELQLQRLSNEEKLLNTAFEQTKDLSVQLGILQRLEAIVQQRYALTVANANVERLSAISQIETGVQLLDIEVKKQQAKYNSLLATVKEAEAQGILRREYTEALAAQYDAVQLSAQSYNFAVRNAVTQKQIAGAIYQQRVEAAGFARSMEIAELASRRQAAYQAASSGTIRRTKGKQADLLSLFADGGYVTRPTAAIIGEGGEPEFVVPRSKADGFVANWIAGRRGAEAIPRFSTGSTGTTPSINVTTGPVMQQGGTRYVTMGDMEKAMQTVVSTILGNSRSSGGRQYQGVR